MATTAKAISLHRALVDALKMWLPTTWVLTTSFDASGNPVLTAQQDSSWAAGEQKFVLVVKPIAIAAESLDVLGLAQRVVSPHVIQFAMEATATAGVSVLKQQFLLPALAEAVRRGCRVDIFHSANTVDPSTAAITGAAVASFDSLDNKELSLI